MTKILGISLAKDTLFRLCSYMRSSWLYIVTNKRNGTLYTGVTSDLTARIWQHRNGHYPGFSRRYGCTRLVWFETHDDISEAIAREKRIKRWRRDWKLALIEKDNLDWVDLFDELTGWVPDSRFAASGMTKIGSDR
ncbi:GIY-YIG nuclease family protein [Henriciella marina]|uniref:GIY-YIG nuclease family protein n=1 Tax=Henriciella marina TaxID=453851 RepID=UPI000382ABF8|nr:GIY-YIG nuclease family protein [Henriciella marina]